MITESPVVDRAEFEAGTGWALRPEGACKGDVCIPLGDLGDTIDLREVAPRMGLPFVGDGGLWALGPESVGGRALVSAEMPDLELADLDGRRHRLSSLRGTKVVVYAWAPY